ncbi:flagellar protein [Rhodobacteraceae bacterium (ex Bugula neritina AB1)]|nr:flagellar protein [Rhodobacteraceae bacterium (ex Bugula neritina AB1)]
MSFTPYVFGTGISGWSFLQRTQAQQQEVYEKSPILDRQVQDFKERITSIQSPEELLDDYSLLQVTLGAFGLDEDINNRAYIQKVLESDPSDSGSFVNRLNDSRYLALATTFGFNSPDGPQLPGAGAGSEFASISTPDDLLSNSTLLTKALDNVGLKGMENNQFFLQQVLESDLSDPESFANKLSDTRIADFARQFEFNKPQEYNNSIQALVTEFNQHTEGLASADDLLEDEELLQAVIETFDLERTSTDFLRRVLNSDTTDPDSFVNQLEDTRYLNVSKAFGFGYPDINAMTDPDELLLNPDLLADALDQFNVSDRSETFLRQVLESDLSDPNSFVNQPENIAYFDFAEAFQTSTWPEHVSKMQVFSDEITDKLDSMTQAQDVVLDLSLFEASLDLFGLGHRSGDFNVMTKTLDSDLSSEISYANLHHDNNMKAMAYAFSFNKGEEAKVYPDGFAEELADLYTTRQFEIEIGNSDPNMRLALALERELQSVADEGGSEDAHWYNIIGSQPLRTVFETALALPSTFAQLDIERQLVELQDRTERAFGVSHPADLLEPDKLDEFRRRFLLMTDLGSI